MLCGWSTFSLLPLLASQSAYYRSMTELGGDGVGCGIVGWHDLRVALATGDLLPQKLQVFTSVFPKCVTYASSLMHQTRNGSAAIQTCSKNSGKHPQQICRIFTQ